MDEIAESSLLNCLSISLSVRRPVYLVALILLLLVDGEGGMKKKQRHITHRLSFACI